MDCQLQWRNKKKVRNNKSNKINMNVELTGTIATVGEPTQVSAKTTIRNFVLQVEEHDGEYSKTQYYPMQLVNKNVDKLSASNSGDEVTIKANLEGRKYTKKDGTEGFILSITAWYVKVESELDASLKTNGVTKDDLDSLPF